MLDLRHLRHAMALAEHGNFYRAAEACHISQPAMTRSIQALEKHLGVKLFHRLREGVELTEFGRVLISRSQDLVLAAGDIEREIQLSKELETGMLVVGIGPYFGAAIAGQLTARLHARFPKLRIKLLGAPWKDFPALIRARKVDLVLASLSELAEQPEFETFALPALPIYWVCRAGHPLTRLKTLQSADLVPYGFASPTLPRPVEEGLRMIATPGIPEEWIQRGLPTIECESSAILISLIKHGDALTMMHPFMIHEELARGELVTLGRLSDQMPFLYGVAWLGGRTLSVAGQAFLDIVRQADFLD